MASVLVMGVVPVGFKEAELALSGIENGYPKAVAEAINKASAEGQKAAVKAITARYTIESSRVEPEITVRKATPAKLDGGLDIQGRPFNLKRFSPDVTMTHGRQEVRVAVIRGNKKLVRGAFRIQKGGGLIMQRRGAARLPIDQVFSLGVAQMAGARSVKEAIDKAMQTTLAASLKSSVDTALEKLAKESARARMGVKQRFQAKEAQIQ